MGCARALVHFIQLTLKRKLLELENLQSEKCQRNDQGRGVTNSFGTNSFREKASKGWNDRGLWNYGESGLRKVSLLLYYVQWSLYRSGAYAEEFGCVCDTRSKDRVCANTNPQVGGFTLKVLWIAVPSNGFPSQAQCILRKDSSVMFPPTCVRKSFSYVTASDAPELLVGINSSSTKRGKTEVVPASNSSILQTGEISY